MCLGTRSSGAGFLQCGMRLEEHGKASPAEESLGLPTALASPKGCTSFLFHVLFSTDVHARVNARTRVAHKHTRLPRAIQTPHRESAVQNQRGRMLRSSHTVCEHRFHTCKYTQVETHMDANTYMGCALIPM